MSFRRRWQLSRIAQLSDTMASAVALERRRFLSPDPVGGGAEYRIEFGDYAENEHARPSRAQYTKRARDLFVFTRVGSDAADKS